MRSERRRIWIGLQFAVLLTLLAFVSVGCVSAATTHYVNPGVSIQGVVDVADPGDTIIVRDGTYTENVEVNVVNLTLQSEHGATFTILQAASTSDHVLEVIANNVTITGFTVENATASDTAGIFVNGVERCTISENTATGNNIGIQLLSAPHNLLLANQASKNQNGIYLYNSNENTLTGNVMFDNTYNFRVYSSYQLEHFMQEIDTSNTVDGKPIYYWVNQHDQAIPADAGFVGIVNSTNITVRGVTVTNNRYGVLLAYTNNSSIENTFLSQNWYGIELSSAINNTIANNTINEGHGGIYLYNSDSNRILNNNTISAFSSGVMLQYADYNTIVKNSIFNNDQGIRFSESDKNSIIDNNIILNDYGIYLKKSGDNAICNNYFDNPINAYDDGTNIWNITQTPGINIIGGSNLGGNYWSDYMGEDTDGDGLGDTMVPYNGDWLPLVYPSIFDTGEGSYPSISGTFTGTITPSRNLTVSTLYTYSCPGTGGHTKSIELYDDTTPIASGVWSGYQSDWHNITFTEVTLLKDHEYQYVIETGSYPQIIHESPYNAIGGKITCEEFIDSNGKRHEGWIPAIRLS